MVVGYFMTGREILERFNILLDSHFKLGGSIHQEPYKGDFFKLFIEAYRNNDFDISSHPRLTGDAIRDYFKDNFLGEENEENDRKLKLLMSILKMWDEWYYALNRVGVEL